MEIFKKAPFLAIVMDTTQDLSKTDQLSLVFRYIKIKEKVDVHNEIKIGESFVGFMSVSDFTAQWIKTEILNAIEKYGIDLSKCRRQGYDGANVMSGVYGGLQTLIKDANYAHCAAHSLNLILNDSTKHVKKVSHNFQIT
ncbi:hypothetical protein TNCV_3390491 [Trichonephila clavipes]|nr:hypothetical protein TNCV_3390491 [Trichonephila clavipes]